jgi:hypothetical protein
LLQPQETAFVTPSRGDRCPTSIALRAKPSIARPGTLR